LGKHIKVRDWDTGTAGWTTATKLQIVTKTELARPVGPTLLPPTPASKNGHTLQEVNPLDCMTWEERFWFAFQAIVELERDLEELQVREEVFRCLTCRREDGVH
jgi:hypothetical protein